MWRFWGYILILVITSTAFFLLRKPLRNRLDGFGSVFELYAIVVALLFFLLPLATEESRFNSDLASINCYNAALAGAVFGTAKDQDWDFNQRYEVDFYTTRLSDIFVGLSPGEKNDYISIIATMQASNVQLDRYGQNEAIIQAAASYAAASQAAIQTNNDIFKDSQLISQDFGKLGITPEFCKDYGFSNTK